ncbi:MAG: aldose epimerase family protein [Microthrixaceae bacterium]
MLEVEKLGTPGVGPDADVDVSRVTLGNSEMQLRILGLGAAVESVRTPDARGEMGEVHLGLPDLASYVDRALNPHLGSSIGRYANRIAGAAFELDGVTYDLDANNGPNTLHGGALVWDLHVWELGSTEETADGATATFWHASPDGDEGFPGTVTAMARFTLAGPTLRIEYSATSDAPTVVAMTNHSYWNLAGGGTVEDHVVTVLADEYLPVDAAGIPTGGLTTVEGTPFDLRSATPLGPAMEQVVPGFDHCFAVAGEPGSLRPAALLAHPPSGRWLSVATDQRGVQLYTGNNLGDPFPVHGSVSLETQALPDSPNRPEFGSVRLDPGDTYRSATEVTFGAM